MLPLIVLDLDATLVDSSNTVNDKIWDKISQAKEAGIKFVISTGRPCEGIAKRISERVGANNPHIFQSGAITSYADGETVKVSALKEANTKAVVAHARIHNLPLEVYTPNEVFVERKTPLIEAHAAMIGTTPIVRDLYEVAHAEPVVRVQWVVSGEQLPMALEFTLEEIQISNATSPVLENTHFISVTRAGVSKGTALKALATSLDIELAHIMVVGDSGGDLPMLELVGHPMVMGNASETLKEKYHTVGSIEELGVIEAIEQALEVVDTKLLQET